MVKKIFFLFLVIFSSQTFSRMEMGVGGMRVTSNEATGFGNGDRIMESIGAGNSGRIMSDCPCSFDIGGLDGIRSIGLPTSFEGNIGGRF